MSEEEIFAAIFREGGTTVTVVIGFLLILRKIYENIRMDAATAEAQRRSLDSQAEIISMLRQEVSRLTEKVEKLELRLAQRDHSDV